MTTSALTASVAVALLHFPMAGSETAATSKLPWAAANPRELSRPLATEVSTAGADLIAASAKRAVAMQELNRISSFGTNWDGAGAEAPVPDSVASARAFLEADSPRADWEVSLHADGRVILEVDSAEKYIELTFGPASKVVVAHRIGRRPMRVMSINLAPELVPNALLQL